MAAQRDPSLLTSQRTPDEQAKRTRWIIFTAFGVIVVACLAIAAVRGDPPTTTETAEVATPSQPRTAGGLHAAVVSWAAANSHYIDTIIADTEANSTASSIDLPSLGAACSRFAAHIRTAQTGRPVPDPTLNASWQGILAGYSTSMQLCIEGARDGDADKFSAATAGMQPIAAQLAQFNAGLERYTR